MLQRLRARFYATRYAMLCAPCCLQRCHADITLRRHAAFRHAVAARHMPCARRFFALR